MHIDVPHGVSSTWIAGDRPWSRKCYVSYQTVTVRAPPMVWLASNVIHAVYIRTVPLPTAIFSSVSSLLPVGSMVPSPESNLGPGREFCSD